MELGYKGNIPSWRSSNKAVAPFPSFITHLVRVKKTVSNCLNTFLPFCKPLKIVQYSFGIDKCCDSYQHNYSHNAQELQV